MVVKLRSRTAVWINSSNLTYSGLVKVVMFTMTIALTITLHVYKTFCMSRYTPNIGLY